MTTPEPILDSAGGGSSKLGAGTLCGHLDLRAEVRPPGRTALVRQGVSVPFHLSKPYWDPDHEVLVVQVANPTAGILAGDRLDSSIEVGGGARLCVTTPSASRVFQMNSGEAVASQKFVIDAGAWLEVMPEPLVLHRKSNYRQRTRVEVASGGGLFFVDQLVPGRVGHGEVWQWEHLALDLWVRHRGKLILRERVGQSGAELQNLAESLGFGKMAAFANAILIEPQASDGSEPPVWRDAFRALHQGGLWAGASSVGPGAWSLRIVAPDGVALRTGVAAMRETLAKTVPGLRVGLRKL